MAVSKKLFGETKDGASIYEYHLTNANGMEAVILNFGCTIKNIFYKVNC